MVLLNRTSMPKPKSPSPNKKAPTRGGNAPASGGKAVAGQRRSRKKAPPQPGQPGLGHKLWAVAVGQEGLWQRIAPFLDFMGQWSRNWGSSILIPLWLITALALGKMGTHAAQVEVWRSETAWFFLLGCIPAALHYFGFRKPVYFYVLGHESTHYLFTKLCGGRVHEFNVSSTGGYIVASKNNWLISLSPYFFPIWAVAAALLFWLLGRFINLDAPIRLELTLMPQIKPKWLVLIVLGALCAYHYFFTVWMVRRDQPDLVMNNVFFSVNLILLANLLSLCLLVVLVTPQLSFAQAGQYFVEATKDAIVTAADWATDLLAPLLSSREHGGL